MAITLEAAAEAYRAELRQTVIRHSVWYLVEGVLLIAIRPFAHLCGEGAAVFATLLLLSGLLPSLSAVAKNSGFVYVTNEKSSTLTVLDLDNKVIKSIKTCARPRGMRYSADRTKLIIACGDDDSIAVYDIATLKLVRRYAGIRDPETFALHPDGKHIYISNEDDSEATVLDLETGDVTAHFPTGAEPEGVQMTTDGKFVFVAAEAANLVHVIDVAKGEVVKSIVTDTRPRRFAMTPDEKELWVTAEIGGVADIIDPKTYTITGRIEFLPPGALRDQVTPVDLLITRDGKKAYVSLGRANHVAVVDVATRQVLDYILVGQRPWGLQLNKDESRLYVANGLSDDLTIIDTASNQPIVSVPVGQNPYGIIVDDQ
jgi:PQQ-dependent catabolism-associated beta-propeller protein